MSLDELASIATPPLLPPPAAIPKILTDAGVRGVELFRFLSSVRNGFYSFESSLHVFPAGTLPGVMDLNQWNDPTLWAGEYGDLAKKCLFFGEDVFGGQFCIFDGAIHAFDPETGEKTILSTSLAEWGALVMQDYEFLTGFPLAHEWQKSHGTLPMGKRLLPKIPFVTEGPFTVDNLYAGDAVEGMRFRADLARQIHDLPDGAKIQFKVTE